MIEVQHLSKTFKVFDRSVGVMGSIKDLFYRKYKYLEAVKDLSFSIPSGQMVGYIGPNGAGKSTSVKMLTGILAPTSGSIRVDGMDPFKDRLNYVRNIGVVFGQRSQLWWDIAVIESLRLLQKIYQVSERDFEERLEVFKRVLEIEPHLSRPVRKLSLGERMRCDLAASLIHNPKVLYLDEPTIGLDLIAKDAVRKFLLEVNQRYNTTIILTTHDLADIEELCERVMIIDRGTLIFDQSLEKLRDSLGGETSIVAKLHSVSNTPLLTDSRIRVNSLDAHTIEARFLRSEASSGEVMKALFDKLDIREVEIREPNIEEIVRAIYVGKGADVVRN